ncbi:MarR family transcriptional regulator [Desulfosarcina ovata subsp. sediminis]|uniref:MarR family transcriptional regulator n=1 Tax=Desulfosarcina ovata subsp. sediminis TaxID=885957 RepID=A0A5K7ZNF4_9BACT|nr:MarR family transcriptional regulator [Desulfosarcina ovata]BBO81817.1 MarR family transcriptional regulator [Desulfosarcina ovata subsp. sediminis]
METKKDLIASTIRELLRITHLYARIEAMPIPVSEEVMVSTREAHTIQSIGERENISVTQVADHFGITKSAASQMIAKLEKRGFLIKKPAAHSNKEFELSLTELGWCAFHAHEHFHGKDFAKLVDSLSAFPISQIATLSVLLETLGGVMQQRLSRHSKS